MGIRVLSCICVAALSASFCCAAEAPGFKVAKTYPVPGDGGFDYVVFDSTSDRLYVSHGTEVNVVDAGTGKLLGTVHNTPGVHGIAIVPELHRGFTTNGGDATVSVFDTQTFQTLKNISVAADPDFTLYDATNHRVLVCHGDSAQITEIDPDREEVTGKIPLGGGAEAAVVASKNKGFVNLEEESAVVAFDPSSLKVSGRWPITGCKTPTGLAIDKANSRLFIGCRSKVLAVMDANNGKVIATLPIGDRVDAVAFDASKKLVFASNGDGTVSVVKQDDADHYTSVGDIKTQPSAKTMAYDPKTGRLFLSAAEMEAAPSGERRRSRPKPGSFHILVVEAQ